MNKAKINANVLHPEQAKNTSNYWEEVYKSIQVPESHSNFAEFVSSRIGNDCSIIDIGCGNGRDVLYFEQSGYKNVRGFDAVLHEKYLGNLDQVIIDDISKYNVLADAYYMRFFVHAIEEANLDHLLLQISTHIGLNSKVFIETRSSKGITDESSSVTYFSSGIGSKHFRILYSKEYLKTKLKKYFKVEFLIESQGWAKFGNEDPFVIRAICKSL